VGVSAEDDDITDRSQAPLELRRAVFGGVRREDVAAMQGALADTQQELVLARAALQESAGWARRLPLALSELARLAAGETEGDDPFERLAAAVQEVAGSHLLASVEFVHIGSAMRREHEEHTDWHGPARPRSSEVRVGPDVLRCEWAESVLAGEETVALVTGLCSAVLLSLLGVREAGARESRGVVTQLGDWVALERHLALRERIGLATATLNVEVEPGSSDEYRSLYGAVSWEAALADAGSTLEEVAHRCGGQAYQVGPLTFRLLVDEDHAVAARDELQERLDGDDPCFDVGIL
jgi:hypothetical protein